MARSSRSQEYEFQINTALKSLLSALQTEKKSIENDDETAEKPRRVLLCLGKKREETAKLLAGPVTRYTWRNPAQANERLRDGKTEIVFFSPDFAAEFGGASILQQKINALPSFERRRMFLVSLEDEGTTMSAHDSFLRNLNLIVNTNDLSQLPLILNRAIHDFNDLYHYFNQAAGMEAI